MPFVYDLGDPDAPPKQEDSLVGLDNTGVRPPVDDTPSPLATLGAAFRQENLIGSVIASARPHFDPVPDYNPLDDIKGSDYFYDHASRFFPSRSPGETQAIMRQIDQEDRDRRTLSAAGVTGLPALAMAGLLDPTMLLPGRIAVGGLREGIGALRGSLEVGGAMAVQSLADEAVLQATQQTRPLSESVASVGSATILGALMGPAISWLSPQERTAATRALDRERDALDAHVARMPDLPPMASAAAPAGAAATDTRTLRPVPTWFGLERLPIDFPTAMLNREGIAGRRALADLIEVPILTEENLRGETTTLGGQAPLETLRRITDNKAVVDVGDTLERLWGDYRFSGERIPFSERMKLLFAVPGNQGPGGELSYGQFKEAVGQAMANNDTHAIPQVQEAAQYLRKRIFDPWFERAQAVFPDLEKAEGEAYFPHLWNKQLIQARRPEFVNTLVSLVSSDNAAKAAGQERLRAFSGALEGHEATIGDLERQLEGRQRRLEDDEALRDEVSRVNRLAFQRAGALRESGAPEVAGRRGGAPFQTAARARINELSDRAQGHVAAVADLEERLSREQTAADAVRSRIEDELKGWEGASATEAKGAMRARETYDAERREAAIAAGREPPTGRLTSADDAVDRAVSRILSNDYDRSVQEVRSYAHEITDHILGSPDGRLSFDERAGEQRFGPQAWGGEPRGVLAARRLNVSNDFAWPWVEHDIEKVIRSHQRTVVPDVLLAERFGDVEMTQVRRQVHEEYARLIDATGAEKDRVRLGAQMTATLNDLAFLRDRFRGMLRNTSGAGNMGRISAMVRNANVPASLGMAMISSISDPANAIARHGLGTMFRDAFVPFLRSMMTDRKFAGEALEQAKRMGITADTIAASRHHEFSGLAEAYVPQSPVERTLQWAADKFNIVNLLGPWTDINKSLVMAAVSPDIYRASKAWMTGTATARQLRALGESNIAPEMRPRIVEQYEQHSNEVDGHRLPNTADWTDPGARQAFEAAIARDADISIVTPGLDKPSYFSNPMAAMLLQFKSFTAAATTRIMLANLQRRDAEVLSGLVSSLAFGMLSYKLASIASGEPTSDRPQDWIKEAMSRGNVLGWLEEANTMASKVTRGGVDIYRLIGADKPLSKFASQSIGEQLMGPTMGKIDALAKVISAASAGDMTASDTHALRRVIATNNLFYLRRAFDEAEDHFNHAFGIPPRDAPGPRSRRGRAPGHAVRDPLAARLAQGLR